MDRCKRCGSTLSEGSKFCGECGAKVSNTCPSCGAICVSGMKFCGECGRKLNAQDSVGKREKKR